MKRLAHIEITIVLSCVAWSQAGAGETGQEDVRAALKEISEARKSKGVFFVRRVISEDVQSRFAEFGDEAVAELRKCIEGKGLVDTTTALVLLGCLRGETGWKLLEGYARGTDDRLPVRAAIALGSLDTERSVLSL